MTISSDEIVVRRMAHVACPSLREVVDDGTLAMLGPTSTLLWLSMLDRPEGTYVLAVAPLARQLGVAGSVVKRSLVRLVQFNACDLDLDQRTFVPRRPNTRPRWATYD
jgi:hypothetical protein